MCYMLRIKAVPTHWTDGRQHIFPMRDRCIRMLETTPPQRSATKDPITRNVYGDVVCCIGMANSFCSWCLARATRMCWKLCIVTSHAWENSLCAGIKSFGTAFWHAEPLHVAKKNQPQLLGLVRILSSLLALLKHAAKNCT